MKYAAFIERNDYSKLANKVEKWVEENRDNILEILDIEYEEKDNVFCATITYLD